MKKFQDFYLVKLGKKEYMEDLYNKGLLYFNQVEYFRNLKYKSDGRADIYEGMDDYYAGNGLNQVEFTINGYKLTELFSISTNLDYAVDMQQLHYTHIYCLSAIDRIKKIFDKKNFAEDKNYAVLIHDVETFLKRVCILIHKHEISCKMSFVEYIDKDNYGGDLGCFKKLNSYSHQNEYRIAIKSESEAPDIMLIGSLNDIAKPPMDEKIFYEFLRTL